MEGPKIKDLKRKRQFVKKLTDAAVDAYDIGNIVVIIGEDAPENVGFNGRLKDNA